MKVFPKMKKDQKNLVVYTVRMEAEVVRDIKIQVALENHPGKKTRTAGDIVTEAFHFYKDNYNKKQEEHDT